MPVLYTKMSASTVYKMGSNILKWVSVYKNECQYYKMGASTKYKNGCQYIKMGASTIYKNECQYSI